MNDTRSDAEVAKSAESYGLPTTYRAAVEEVHEWREASQVVGYFTPDSLRKYLVAQGRHHDEHHASEKRLWDAIGGEPEDDADPEVRELDDAVRATIQYERDQTEQARSVIDMAKAALPEYLHGEPDLVFAVKVLAGHYASQLKTATEFAGSLKEAHAALRALTGGHIASEVEAELAKESNGSPFALGVRALDRIRKHRCLACGKLTRDTTAGCDHCELEDK